MANLPIKIKKTTTERGYGYAHERQRAELIQKFPLCQACGKAWSRHLHHCDGNPFNRAAHNVLMLCESCHKEWHRHPI